MVECMLTTVDNPYDPFTHFEEWYQFDTSNGYYSCGLLDRISRTSPLLSDADNHLEISNAIDIIVNMHNGKLYKKVERQVDSNDEEN